MQKRESKFSILFRHWIMANPQYTSALEMKQTQTDSIPFSCLKEDQITFALAIKNSEKGVLVRTEGAIGLPDYIYLRKEPSFVVIKFPDFFCAIDIEAFIEEKEKSKRKSLTSERAKEISSVFVSIG